MMSQSSSHTRDAMGDIKKIVHHLLSEGFTKEQEVGEGSGFQGPRVLGSKVSEGKLDDYLKEEIELEEQDTNIECGEADIKL